MTEIAFDAGAVGDTVANAKTALDDAIGDNKGGGNVSDPRVADALEKIRGTTKEGQDEAEGHLDTGATAARNMEASDAEGASAAGTINSGGAPAASGGGGAARVQPSVQVTPAAISQMKGMSPSPMPMQMASPMPNPVSNLMNAASMVAPVASQVAQVAAPAPAVSTAGKVALTPSQQAQLVAALSENSESVSSKPGSLDLGAASGETVELAKKLVAADIPYAWGGGTLEGPSQGISDGGGAADAHGDYNKVGLDCSGLSRYMHYQSTGEEVPRTSQAQFAAGTEVSINEAKPGDFVFPNSSFSGGGGPGHVQVYLGDGKVIEAPQSGDKVKISEMTPSVIKRM
ncbi:C40 family peptidase [Rhodococcus qingshengii]|uniref:C40 family peptidase n=1 Tax=Rhodococcus qingshengii TaxID=334542 RepID=UPI001F1449BA|nr:NlpC/P60 family protein [Rhodococcus qingshengii]ULD38949.1 NlpC/P60 family protein [Rhodococcus qingshengii]